MDLEKVEEILSSLRDSEVRYRLYRLRTEADGGAAYDLEPEIKEYFESTDYFVDWTSFAYLWDAKKVDGKWVTYSRRFTEAEEWNAVLRRETTVLPMRRLKANKLTDE